ncbi:conserved domain protein [Streptococcus infantis SK970]|nr:conserved domain protein [Streptococcus infantis SK970]
MYFRPFFFTDVDDFHQLASDPENLQFIFLRKLVLKKVNMLLPTTL